MKRLRNDPSEYLGGDLDAALATTDRTVQLTRSQRNAARREANLQWRLCDRKVGSGIDPNPRHTSYYRAQIPELADSSEWTRFQKSLCTSLNVTFRLGWMCPRIVKDALTRKMASEFRLMAGKFIEVEGRVLQGDMVKPIEWLDNADDTTSSRSGMKLRVWQLAVDSRTLSNHSSLQGLSSFLRSEVLLGHVIRQELVSMVPATLLKVSSHHMILDVCSAPGSKTEQLLYLLQQASMASDGTAAAGWSLPTGMVVANDADPVRMGTLRTRYQRCWSPNLVATCARAEDLQRLIGRPVFDRIIADVPCSGDGTIRKFPHIWRLFRPRMALELHGLQLQIAIASVLLLKPGGRMVYSTCSINPIEDEAVVSALLRHFGGALRLVDTRMEMDDDDSCSSCSLLPRMVSSPGLSSWRCDEEIFAAGEPSEAARRSTMGRLPALLLPSMRPPSEEEAAQMHLEYCHRILPQHNDCGGFFVAVLELDEDYRSSSSSSSSTSRRGVKREDSVEISERTSLEVMRRLGYNPKARSSRGDAGAGVGVEGPSLQEEEEEEGGSRQTATLRSMTLEEREVVMDALQLQESGGMLHMWEAAATTTSTKGGGGGDDDGGVTEELLNRLIKQQQKKSRAGGRYHDLALADQLLVAAEAGGDQWLEIDPHLTGGVSTGTRSSTRSSSSRSSSGSSSRQVCLVSAGVHGALESWGPGFVRAVLQAGVCIASSISSCDLLNSACSAAATASTAAEVEEDNIITTIIPRYLLNPDCASIVLPLKTAATVVALRLSDFQAWVRLCIAIKAASLAAAKEEQLLLSSSSSSSSMRVQVVGEEVDPSRVESMLLDAAASRHESKSFTDMYCRWMMMMTMMMRSTSAADPSPVTVPAQLHAATMEEEGESKKHQQLSPAAIEALLQPYLSLKEAVRHPTRSRSQAAAAVHIFVTLDNAADADAASSSTNRARLPHGEGPASSSSSSSSKRRLSKFERKRLKSQSSRGPTAAPPPLQATPIIAAPKDKEEEVEGKGASQQAVAAAAVDHHQTLHPVIALRYSLPAVTEEDSPSVVLCTAADTCLSYDTALRTR